MAKRKKIRSRGKISLSKYFKNIKKGDLVSVVKEHAVSSVFPDRIQGMVGVVEDCRGKSFIVKFTHNKKEKRFLIEPIHLRKIKTIKAQ